MKKAFFFLVLFPSFLFAQQLAPLTVQKIMRDPNWIGTSPSEVFWSADGSKIYFQWNPEKAADDSLYMFSLKDHTPQKVVAKESATVLAQHNGVTNNDRTSLVYVKDNAIFLLSIKDKKQKLIYSAAHRPHNPTFVNDHLIAFQIQQDLYTYNSTTGAIKQIIHFIKGEKPTEPIQTPQAQFLKNDALENSVVLAQREKKDALHKKWENANQAQLPKDIYIGKHTVSSVTMSPNGKYITYQLMHNQPEYTNVPNYITASGDVEMLKSRPVVGSPQPTFKNYIYSIKEDTVFPLQLNDIPGIRDIPKYIKEHYKEEYAAMKKKNALRSVYISHPFWNEKGNRAFVVVRAQDHKDRWIMSLDIKTGKLTSIDRQHDDAWIGGPGIGYPYEIGNVGWVNNHEIWYQSEKTGYSHLYISDLQTGKQTQLTNGDWAVWNATLSPDHSTFYITTNQGDPGQRQFYHLDIASKALTRITQKEGGYQVTVSPDGKQLALLYSTAIHPWELYLQKNKKGATELQVTHKAESKAYQSYPWRAAEYITFKNRDNDDVHAAIYKPKTPAKTHPAVIFVHGAGYLQDVKKSWSYYFREHMFFNLLCDQGYTVLNIDYRGSAGYGRDWRTAIYRFMGGDDLNDIVSGAEYLITEQNINPDRIGIFGGSYGGFMTLMAMFRTNVFTCGAALRSVTDWAHYNHDYTSDILNTPQLDSIAYLQSSPIYYADGLQGHLLMCHGMVDVNVHYQDIIRLTQRLIELGKNDWELTSYPMESHGFKEPSSWTDEYTRIYNLFERLLK